GGPRGVSRRNVHCPDVRDRGPGRAAAPSGHVRRQRVRGGGRSDGLWDESARYVPAQRVLRGQDSQGCEARRPPSWAADQLRVRHQPQDRQGAWPDDPAVAPGTGGSGSRIVERRAFIGMVTGGLLAAPLVAEAQQTKVYRVGFLFHGSPPPPGEISSPLILTNLVLTNTLPEL